MQTGFYASYFTLAGIEEYARQKRLDGVRRQSCSSAEYSRIRIGAAHRNRRKARRSMQGEILEVYEVDEWGGAWVTQWWGARGGKAQSHSLALRPEEMEVVVANAS